jgi:glucose-6-phosphate 1-epimerase
MPSISELNERLAITGIARFEAGGGGLPRLVLTSGGAEAHIYLHGAHVTHYQPAGQAPMLFTSARSHYEAGKPIRGGIPVIFPWFGPRQDDPHAPMHGMVRTRQWQVESIAQIMDSVLAQFTFSSDDQTRAAWPHDFNLRLGISVGRESLKLDFMVENTSPQPFAFEEALHTYLSLDDIRQTTIRGLQGTQYLDKNLGMSRNMQSEEVLRLTGPIDRVYLDSQAFCQVEDHAAGRDIWVLKDNSHSTIVWNPWSDKIAPMSDLDPQDWPRFVCVESGNVKQNAITLRPSEKYVMDAEIATRCPDLGM